MKIYLNPREEEVMQILWKLKKAFVKDILAEINADPKPPYNTVSSVVRKLVANGYIGYNAYGNTHQYYPILKKSQYANWTFRKLFEKYFEGSPEKLLSHFMREEQVAPDELKAILKNIKKNTS